MLRHAPLALLAASVSACLVDPGNPDSGTTPSCPAATGSGTTHSGFITANETWAASGNPHLVTADVRVNAGVRLTIEPCAEVRLSGGAHLSVEGTAIAEGTAQKPIRIEAAQASAPFGAIQVWAPGTLSLAYATVKGGGSDTTNSYGAIEARGDQLLPAQKVLKVNNVAVAGAVQYGVSLRAGAAFTDDSAGLTISGSGKAPVRALPRLLTNLPSGTYTGNALDAIVVETESYGDVSLEDVTIKDRGVPYHLGGDFSLGGFNVGWGTAPVRLTIEPGVVLKFKKQQGAGLHVDRGSQATPANGTLVAVGTAAKPIVFTSQAAAPAAGDWAGLTFGKQPQAANQLAYVEIRYAGGPSGANSFHCQPGGGFSTDEDAAIAIYGQPPSAFVTNSTFADSAGAGVNLAYSGSPVDFLPTNTFTNLADCKVTTPRQSGGACPATVSCP